MPTFQKFRMEMQADGSVSIGVGIEDPDGVADANGDRPILTCEWRNCFVAHVHGWDVCDIAGIFGARAKDDKGQDIVGSSVKEQLIARLATIKAAQAAPKEVALPTKQVNKQDDKGANVLDDKGAAIKVAVPDKALAI